MDRTQAVDRSNARLAITGEQLFAEIVMADFRQLFCRYGGEGVVAFCTPMHGELVGGEKSLASDHRREYLQYVFDTAIGGERQ